MKHDDLNLFVALSAWCLGHVTCYLCFIGLKEKYWKSGAEMEYNKYILKRYCWNVTVIIWLSLFVILAGMVDKDFQFKR